jgi:mannose/fructose/N-acetylgalactosamine-specific phosphotransferase system component IID
MSSATAEHSHVVYTVQDMLFSISWKVLTVSNATFMCYRLVNKAVMKHHISSTGGDVKDVVVQWFQ